MNIDYGKLKKLTKEEKRDIVRRSREIDVNAQGCPNCGHGGLEWEAACPSYFSDGRWWSCMNCGNATMLRCYECDWEYQDLYRPDPNRYGTPPEWLETIFLAQYLHETRDRDLWEYDDDGHHWEKPHTRKIRTRGNLRHIYFVQDGEPDPYADPEYAI